MVFKMRKIISKFSHFLFIFGFFLLTYLIIPFETVPEMALIVFIFFVAISKLPRNLQKIYKCMKKYWRSSLIIGFMGETFIFMMVISGTIILLTPRIVPYAALFWLTSSLMRMCLEMTPLVYKENMQKMIKFYQDFAVIRLAFFLLPVLYFVGWVENLQYLAFILIFLLSFSFFSLPIISFILEPKKLEMRVKILRSLYPNKKCSIREIADIGGSNQQEAIKLLKRLKHENIVESVGEKYQLSERVRLLIR